MEERIAILEKENAMLRSLLSEKPVINVNYMLSDTQDLSDVISQGILKGGI